MPSEPPAAAVPASVYRLQLSPGFTFEDARRRLRYLKELGIEALYLSPCMQAAPGSTHGYDVSDPARFSEELGGEAGFLALSNEAKALELKVLLDWVPNHMGISVNNPWWSDVLENGQASPYSRFFDIDWRPAKVELHDKVLLPVLGDLYGRVLEEGGLKLDYAAGSFRVLGAGRWFPVAPETYPMILERGLETLPLSDGDPDKEELLSVITAFRRLPGPAWERSAERIREKEVAKRRLDALARRSEAVRKHIEAALAGLAGSKDDPASFEALDKLLSMQHYRLACWRVAAQEINYRRFFNIHELAAIRIEEEAVFRGCHELLLRLVAERRVDGLRIDHIDGLYDPAGYLARLQAACAEAAGLPPGPRPFYVVVEKILDRRESLPEGWAAHGTVGYEFLNTLGGLFVDQAREAEIDEAYEAFTGHRVDFDRLVYSTKKLFAAEYMASEVHSLGQLLDRLTEGSRHYRDFTGYQLTTAVREIVENFPVYRTYIAPADEEVTGRDEQYVRIAVEKARHRSPALEPGLFDFLLDVLLLRIGPPRITASARARYRDFVLRLQQLTGPIMAKGLEDTALYSNSRLLSLNEVGGDPTHVGVSPQDFHKQNAERAERWPAGLLATSTHDTKRSEDLRSRLSALSEVTPAWKAAATRWAVVNGKHKTEVDGRPEPSGDTEYFIYQTLLGVWPDEPIDDAGRKVLLERLWEHCLKAVREAKQATNWVTPRAEYEAAIRRFLEGLLEGGPDNRFLQDFDAFQARVAELGRLNALSQLTLKLGSPGVVDVYQGSELWSYRLVDPDNRRPVDFDRADKVLAELSALPPESGAGELFASRRDGRVKMLLLHRGLALRRRHPGLFVGGEYLPLRVEGSRARNCVAFARKSEDTFAVAAAGRLFADLGGEGAPPLGAAWGDTAVLLPGQTQGWGFRDAYTGRIVAARPHPEGAALDLAVLFETLPCALLTATR